MAAKTAPEKPAEDPKKFLLILANVRISYPNVFVAKKPKGKENDPKAVGKYSASFLFNKSEPAHMKQIETIKEKITLLLKENNKGANLAPDKLCLRDGTFKPDTEGYGDGVMFITSNNSKRPSIKDKHDVRDAEGKLVNLEAEDERFFAGCRVNAVLRLWFQDNAEGGKRVNASLESIQYVGPDEPFSTSSVDADEAFGSLEQESSVDDTTASML